MATSSISSTSSGSGLDVSSVVSQLMQVESRPLTEMQRRQSVLQSRISAFGAIKGAYSAVGDAAKKLQSVDLFRAVTSSSSDATKVGASASAGAARGSYSVTVAQLAQSQKLASSAFPSTGAVVGSGTLNIQFGTFAAGTFSANAAKPALAVTIGPGQNTLAGVRDAINAANGGVVASLVNDGSGHRLVLSSAESGTANSLRILVNDDDGNHTDTSGLSQLAFNPAAASGSGANLTQRAAALDAQLTIDGLAITRPTNQVQEAIEGVTLNLNQVTAGTPVTVTVGQDAAAARTAINDLVKAYNNMGTMIKNFTGYNAQTGAAGALSGDSAAAGLLARMKTALTTALPGLTNNPGTLSDIGLGFQRDGSLGFDSAKFDRVMQDPAAQVARLFATTGAASNALVSFAGSTEASKPGTYGVTVTQAASRGSLTGSAAANLTIASGINDTLGLSVNGIGATIQLTAGTYTASALAAELQSKVNGVAALRAAGVAVSVSESGGTLSLTSTTYGSASAVTNATGNAAADLFGGAPVSQAGTDVQGSIGGLTTSGLGQELTASNGLRVKVTSTAPGALGNLEFRQGYGTQISALVSAALKSDGTIANRTDSWQKSIQGIQAQQTRFNNRLTLIEANLRKQYTALDRTLSSMNSTSTYLTQQLTALQKQTSS